MLTVCICMILSCPMVIKSMTSKDFSEADQCRQLKFRPEKAFDGKRLINHLVRINEVMVMEFCETMCYMEPNCVSINIDKRVDGKGKYKCELNNVTHEGHNHELIENGNYFYHAAESACVNNPCKNNATCQSGFTDKGYHCLCTAGFKGSTCDEVSTCKEVYDRNTSTVDKLVTLHIDSKPISVFCHMKIDGCGNGGWTPVMKIDGDKDTFHFGSHYWTDKNEYSPFGGQTAFDRQETKLSTYWNTPFSKICLGMKIDQQLKFIVIKKQADSLYSLIADERYRSTSLGREKWKALIGSRGSLQLRCNKEGFNAVSDERHSRARIGILGNNENECNTCDSRIGFGTGGDPDNSITCGNAASWFYGSDNGKSDIKTMGYILVQ